MRILIVSPLFPPDVAAPAPYVKELATRLSGQYAVSLLIYGHLPESVPGAKFTIVNKAWPSWLRLPWFTVQLIWLAGRHDRILLENGMSTELPALVMSFIYGKRCTLQDSDHKVTYTGWQKTVHRLLKTRVKRTIEHATDAVSPLPLPRPEAHPFRPSEPRALGNYEQSWEAHIAALIPTSL